MHIKRNQFIHIGLTCIIFITCVSIANEKINMRKNQSITPQLSGKWLSENAKYLPINEFKKNKFDFDQSIESVILQANIKQKGRFFAITLNASTKRRLIHEPDMKNLINKANDVRYCVFNYNYKSFLCTDTDESITSFGELISNNHFFITNIESGVHHKNSHVWYADFKKKL